MRFSMRSSLHAAPAPNRRTVLRLAGAGAFSLVLAGGAVAAPLIGALNASQLGVKPDSPADQSAALQRAIAQAVKARLPLYLPPGTYRAGGLSLPAGASLVGVPGASRLVHASSAALLEADGADGIRLEGLTFDGRAGLPLADGGGLVALRRCGGVRIVDCVVSGASSHGISLDTVGGEVSGCTIERAAKTGLFAINSTGLAIRANEVRDIGNNGVQVWRSDTSEDGTLVLGNRISHVASNDGGDGQNGNGINIFRAGSVIVADNRISDCAFSAVRGNAASNLQIRGNNCARLGETALYAEFGFQGAVVAGNIVDGAASGINVTNFNEGGRLAVVQGNIVRNLVVKAPPDYDSSLSDGIAITVEADTSVTGNVVDRAPKIGIRVGYGAYARNVTVVGNIVRDAGIGIGASVVPGAGDVLISDNLVAGARMGAVVGLRWNRPATEDLAAGQAAVVPSNLTVTGNRVH